jgi:hypothetical protein
LIHFARGGLVRREEFRQAISVDFGRVIVTQRRRILQRVQLIGQVRSSRGSGLKQKLQKSRGKASGMSRGNDKIGQVFKQVIVLWFWPVLIE